MKESIKEFWSEHGWTTGLVGATVALLAGKLVFGLGIGWGWVFAPLWMPLAAVCGLMGMMMVVLGMVMVALFGMVAVASYMDKDFVKKMEAMVDEDETPEPDTVESETSVQEENGTLQ